MKSYEIHVFTKAYNFKGEWLPVHPTGGDPYRWPTSEQARDYYTAPEIDRKHYKVVEVNEAPNIMLID